MLTRRFISTLLLSLCFVINSSCQEIDTGFIKENLAKISYPLDTEASAIVLLEKYTVEYSQKKTVHKIIKILRSDAADLANVTVLYPLLGNTINLTGTTFNLDGDKLVVTPLQNDDKHYKSLGNNTGELSFTMPAVKEGSVIEYTYVVVTGFNFSPPVWHIQEKYPKIISEYELIFPNLLDFKSISHVNEKVASFPGVQEAMKSTNTFCNIATGKETRSSLWLRKNVEAIKEEPYVLNINKNVERMEIRFTGMSVQSGYGNFQNSWEMINNEFWQAGSFKQLESKNKFFNEVVDSISEADTSEDAMIRSIYCYVRSHFDCKPDYELSRSVDLHDIFKSKKGNIFTINLLLTAMLMHAHISASPTLISTTSNLPLLKDLPILDRANYMSCTVTKRDSSIICLDASDKNNVYGFLPPYCYNGFAWVCGPTGRGIQLTTDMLLDKTISAMRMYDFTDSSAKLELVQKLGLVQSENLRKTWAEDEKKAQDYLDKNIQDLPGDIAVLTKKINNIDNPDTNLVIKLVCNFTLDKKADHYFLSATAFNTFRDNPFKSTVRILPIEFSYKTDYKYCLTVNLPQNMEPDTVRKPILVDYEAGAMTYGKVMNYTPDLHIFTLNSTLSINVTQFSNESYGSIRDFFQKMIKENNEMLTFKRTKKI